MALRARSGAPPPRWVVDWVRQHEPALLRSASEPELRIPSDGSASLAPAAASGGRSPSAQRARQPKLQVLLGDAWVDVPGKEFRQIRELLRAGEVRFSIQARGNTYIIDFTDADSPTQTNLKSGTKRKLRVLNPGTTRQDSLTPTQGDRSIAVGPPNADAITTAGSMAAAIANSDMYSEMSGTSPVSGIPGREQGSEAEASPAPTGAVDPGADANLQVRLGPQSKRGNALQYQLSVLDSNEHAKKRFQDLAANEEKLCGPWAVFYHSYSFSALLYEVQAAVGAVLFRFRSQYAPLPRILVHEFEETPDAPSLIDRFNKKFAKDLKDHHPEYRAVGLSAMCSLVSLGPEASTPVSFNSGYSQRDVQFRGVLEDLLQSCQVPKAKIKTLAQDIIDLSESHGLDVSQFGGQPCKSGKAGHLLQIFLRRDLLDQYVYASHPWGNVDDDRQPISSWLNGDNNTSWGQARIVAHPTTFMQATSVRMFVASADPTFDQARAVFQEKLTALLKEVLGDAVNRERAATSIYGGALPDWWTSEDQRRRGQAPAGRRLRSRPSAGAGQPI